MESSFYVPVIFDFHLRSKTVSAEDRHKRLPPVFEYIVFHPVDHIGDHFRIERFFGIVRFGQYDLTPESVCGIIVPECGDAIINPGQQILFGAFASADVKYDPSLYRDKFEGVSENFDNPGEPREKPDVEVATEFFSPSPNPFNPMTTMSYTLANPEHVTLTVYNSMGQKVETLVDSYMNAGDYSVIFDGSGFASGMYFYRFEAGDVVKTGRMTMVK